MSLNYNFTEILEILGSDEKCNKYDKAVIAFNSTTQPRECF